MDTSWMQPEATSSRPSEEEREASLRNIGFRGVPVETTAVLALLDAFRSVFGEEHVHLAVFDVVGADGPAAWFLSRGEHEAYPVADELLRSPGFAEALPEVVPVRLLRPPGFRPMSPLMLDGSLATVLTEGGPRRRLPGSGAEAKSLAGSFCADLLGDRYDEVLVEHSVAQWSLWFKGVAWDHTWVVVDRRLRRLTALCLTDGD